ncbi:DUF3592 domain-containing protein [Microbulbifer yueqingensis]|uniref:DUF3592 domain-containing protein n=1 Tax=Microbulbifer yueqingensis TaxID=658219 RepID=A0A1G9EJM0_9GAMM|nr:DUF3592 domain-containing protein [Microbulbifer yueqingensis]SDK76336.1 Protein of unknown function [Microbulbifer yueqingensis]
MYEQKGNYIRERLDQAQARPQRSLSFEEKYSGRIILIVLLLSALAAFASTTVFLAPALLAWCLLGCSVIKVNLQGWRRARASRYWPRASAQLQKAETSLKRSSAGGNPSYFYGLDLLYSYRVGGREYTGSNYHWEGYGTQREEKAIGTVEKLRSTGPGLMVHYNPRHPSESVIYPTVPVLYFIGVMVGLAMSIASITFGLHYWGLLEPLIGVVRSM